MKIKTKDTVKIIAGKDKGKTGTIHSVDTAREKVVIEGINTVTKHQKNRRSRSKGQIVEKSAPIHVSNVALLVDDTPVRVGYTVEINGTTRNKVRVARPSGKKI